MPLGVLPDGLPGRKERFMQMWLSAEMRPWTKDEGLIRAARMTEASIMTWPMPHSPVLSLLSAPLQGVL